MVILAFLNFAWATTAKANAQNKVEVVLNLAHADAVSSVAFSADGTNVLSGTEDKTLKLWDVATGKLLRTFKGHTDYVHSVAFLPDGTRTASGSWDGTLKLWDVGTRLLQTSPGQTNLVYSVAFSPDCTRVLLADTDDRIAVWDLASGMSLVNLFSQAEDKWLAITEDGFFSASPKGEQIVHVVSGLELTTTGQVHQSLFSPDLVREADPDGEVKRAAEVINLDKVLGSGPAPRGDRFGPNRQ